MRKKRLKILLLVLLGPIVLVCAFLLVERIRGQISVAAYKRELTKQGEKLTFQELIPPAPVGENGTPSVYDAIGRLKRGEVMPGDYPPVMQLTPSGSAVAVFREDNWVYDGDTNRWEQLAADLEANEVTLAELREALSKPVLNNSLDYARGHKMSLTHLAPPKSAGFWFGAATQLALRKGRNQDAIENLIADIRLAGVLAEDRLVISELVRIAIAAIARCYVWEALQTDGWTDEQLARLQTEWQSSRFITNMAVSLEGDRIFSLTAYESLRKSNKEAVELLFWQELIPGFIGAESHEAWWRGLVSREWYCRVWRFTWSHQDERNCMKRLQQLIEIARDAAAKKSYAEVSPVIESFQEDCLGGFYDQLRFPSSSQSALTLAVSLRRAMRAETERSLVIGAIALKRYSLRHGRLPDTLDALVPEFLSSVPVDYMDGKPLKYRSNGDGTFRLYSVGANFIDDGGDATLLPDEIHARAPWARKDVVWPMPATAEELDAYRKESAKN